MKALVSSYETYESRRKEFDEVATAKILLEHGADVHAKDEIGKLHTIKMTLSIYDISLSINITL